MTKKKAYIITGPESSGSVFISKVVSYVVGKDKVYGEWDGYGWNGELGDDIVCLHRSQPYISARKYCTLEDFKSTLPGYEIYFILTTRDNNIVSRSKISRFSRSANDLTHNRDMSRNILTSIIESGERSFIWNYETSIYLRDSYFRLLYEFLGATIDFIPQDLRDGNHKHIKRLGIK